MNDVRVLDNLFNKHNDQIDFELFKKSNVIAINNENGNDFNKEIIFNTRTLASNLINYKNAYILLNIHIEVPHDYGDQGKKSVPGIVSLKKSYELLDYLMIKLNNVIISNESNINRSSLVNYVLNNGNKEFIDYKNLEKANSCKDLNIENYQFITKDTYLPTQTDDIDNTGKFHHIDFEIPIYLKDISNFFRKTGNIKICRI